MGSPEILDFERLLAPVPGDNPAGGDLRQDASPNPVYYQIKDARSAARAAERNLDAPDETGTDAGMGFVPEWRTILQLAPDVLAERSKDLEVAAWLVEALVRVHGFAGLRDGFRLVHGLVEGFWDGLYPAEDEDGVVTKVAPLAGLNGEGVDGALIQPLRKVPITGGEDPGPFSLWHYEQASELVKLPEERREQRIAAGAVTLEQFEASARATSPEFYRQVIPDLQLCLSEFKRLNELLQERCGREAPPSSRIEAVLESALQVVQGFGGQAVESEAAPAEGGAAAPDGTIPRAAAAPGAGEALRTREDAFRTLLKIAAFFRETEPHSPLSYTLEELVRRGRMPLPDLLGELIPDETARRTFLLSAGIKPADSE